MDPLEKKKVLHSLVFPSILLAIIWIVKLVEVAFNIDFSGFGIYPQHAAGLIGIILSPLLHAGFAHLSANSVPLFVLTAGLFYFYGRKSAWIFSLLWLVTGFWVWVFAKDTGIHIGASGVVYALAAFHFTGGVIRKEPRLMAFSLLVVFLYGGLIWGIIPNFLPEKNISWESHLMGLLAGAVIAVFYKNVGPTRKEYSWEEDEDEPDEEPPAEEINFSEPATTKEDTTNNPSDNSIQIIYHIRNDNNSEPPPNSK
ncbi:MAG: rhomboid family intramembrane serine protease [Bacteroidetes bacterium]|nr:rhomboid family intramembrane serine protease [Bacteroidota bacterium]